MDNIWQVDVRQGWLIGLTLEVIALLLTVTLIVVAILTPLSLTVFILALAALATLGLSLQLIYHLWGLANAGYEMDRNALTIRWGGTTLQIPMASVRAVIPGTELKALRMRPGLRWPGNEVGMGRAEGIGDVLFFATRPADSQVIIRTDAMAYSISPIESEAFLLAFRERLEMGPTQEVAEKSTHPAFLDWPIWHDRLGLGLLTSSTLLLILLVGMLCWRYPTLPAEIILRRTASGDPLLLAAPLRIFYFALLGAALLLVNGLLGLLVYRRSRIVTYYLWSGLVLIQVSLWVAALGVVVQK